MKKKKKQTHIQIQVGELDRIEGRKEVKRSNFFSEIQKCAHCLAALFTALKDTKVRMCTLCSGKANQPAYLFLVDSF